MWYGGVCLILLAVAACSRAQQSTYLLGAQGLSCSQVCQAKNLNCNPNIVTNNVPDQFKQLGVTCTPDADPWWAEDQPAYISNSSDPNYGKCLGYMDVPAGVICAGSYQSSQRLCRCDTPSPAETLFGTGVSAYRVTTDELYIFQHVVAPGDYGVLTHFWFTMPNPTGDGLIISYYIDGETTPSISFTPSVACGVGFDDTQAPWGTKWFGKGANDNSYFINFKIPFQKSIVVTARHQTGTYGGFYMIVRGATNLDLSFGGLTVPSTARMNLFKVDANYDALDFVTMAEVPEGTKGALFQHTLTVASGNENCLEGCYHAYLYQNQSFPGVVLSTGTEDYFDSGWYFNAGEFHFPVAGYTHFANSGGVMSLSAYRFHEMDPLYFNDGFRFDWRNGDMVDKSGVKCLIETGGGIVGSPTATQVLAYTWVYTW